MTAPRVLSPEEWEARQKNRPLSPEEWDLTRKAMAGLGTRRIPLPSAAGDVTREVGGVPDPEAWKTTIHKPGFIERNVTGALGLPFAAVAHPVETAGAMVKAAVTDPFKPGMYVAKKLNEAVGLPAPSDRFNVSGEEAAQSALNTALMVAPSLLKAVRGASAEVAAPVRAPREGIGRIPAAEVTPRTEAVSGLADLLDRLREAEPTTGDVPQKVPFPPATRVYPLGATTGDLLEGGVRKPFREPLPTPYTREGVVRRPASNIPSPQEWEAAQKPTVSTSSAALRPAPRPTLGPPKVTAEMMLDMGKRRAAELDKSPEPPELAPAMEAHGIEVPKTSESLVATPEPVSFGRDLAEPSRIPELPKPPGGKRYPVVGSDEISPSLEGTAIAKGGNASPWKDLSEVPDWELKKELDRIQQLHAEEEASVAFQETPEWVEWQNLPAKEKLGRSTRTTDEFGNRIKRQQEDLPDATMDPDVLAERRKTLSEYNKRTLMRKAEVQRADRIAAELERRERALENAPELPPPSDEPFPPPSTGEGTTVPAVRGTGEARTRGLAVGVNQRAIAERLTTSLGDLPEYNTVNMAEQAAKATKLLADDPELAARIAKGESLPPNDLLPESVFTAVENKAIAEGDVGMLRELASGDLTTQATTMGQRIRALAERSPESPVAAIQQIVEARMGGAKNARAATRETVQTLQRHIAEAVKMDPKAWTTFIDGLRC